MHKPVDSFGNEKKGESTMTYGRPTYGKHKWKNCNDCEYAHSMRFCNFMEITGRSRIVYGAELYGPGGGNLLPGGGCRLKKPTDVPIGNGHLTVDQLDEMEGLYNSGLTDPEIAEIIGCHRNSVLRWRRRNTLPANG